MTASAAGGAALVETASARCSSALAALAMLGRCGDELALRRQRDEHERQLRAALAARAE